jgi:hypothetical protein
MTDHDEIGRAVGLAALDASHELSHRSRPTRHTLEQGHVRWKLIHELARGERTVTELAARYGVTHGAISRFRDRYPAEIAEIKADIENEFAGLWIAQKLARLAEYAADVEMINDAIGAALDAGTEIDAALLAAKHRALRSVAEELGQLPTKIQMQVDTVTRVHYTVEGMNVGDLR